MSVARPWIKRAVILGVIIVAGILIWNSGDSELIIFGKNPSYSHYIQVTAPSAFEAIPGERVTEGGIGVGTITKTNVVEDKATGAAEAHLVLGIANSAWPIPQGSVFNLRMGGTAKFTDRFISITKPAQTDGAVFADNASIPAKQFIVPVEYNALFDVFNAETRAGLKAFFNNTSHLAPAAPSFRAAVNPPTASALGQVSAVFSDLGYDQQALSTLVSSTAEITGAVASANPGVSTLLQSAASTFGTLASQSHNLQTILATGSTPLHTFGVTTRELAKTLPHVQTLVNRLNPGLTQLDEIADPLNSTLREVVDIEPTAVNTLSTVRNHGPQIDDLLTDAKTSLLPQLTTIAGQAVPILDCIRPYTPDITSFLQGWGGFFSDGFVNPQIHVLHAKLDLLPFTNAMPIDTSQMEQLYPALKIDYPSPPGAQWDEPWYQPQCGVNTDDNNAADDPEAHTFGLDSGKTIDYGPTTTPNYGTTSIP